MLIQTASYGMPAGLVSTIVPALAFQQTNIWHNDLTPNVMAIVADDRINSAGDMQQIITVSDDYNVEQLFAVDVPLQETITAEPDAFHAIAIIDNDSFGALETGGEFEGCLNRAMVETEDPWSLPRYTMTGQTLDCDTSAPIAGATIRQFRSVDNWFVQQLASDGGGNYALPIFDQQEYFLTAHSGQSPAGITRRDLKGV